MEKNGRTGRKTDYFPDHSGDPRFIRIGFRKKIRAVANK
ncbi:hypothetical protein B4135_3270 [Caldibacillus debilis]|uniref:Uncharacterized protein n=1 Tax=Caldibacillus debilis TaxID=301148 RepID=A0A150LFZ8_9BACI|nr:hypothetical protein B4135_3270 [Caldibacillus debilis]